jgi:hypothetical protein
MNSRATRVRVRGPLGPYADGFRAELAALGYKPSSAAGQLQVMAHLSRWLVDRGLHGHELTSSVVEEFLRARRVAGYGQWLSSRGMAPLLNHLREVGIAPVCSPAVADSAVEVLLAAYLAYLIEERGLAASTVRNYVDVARQFVSEYCASGRGDLCGLTAAQVSEFVLAGCRTRGVGSARFSLSGCGRCCATCIWRESRRRELAQAPIHIGQAESEAANPNPKRRPTFLLCRTSPRSTPRSLTATMVDSPQSVRNSCTSPSSASRTKPP